MVDAADLLRRPVAADNAAMEAEPNRKRRWFQFSLRTLLIGVTSLAALCALLAAIWHGKLEQRRIVAELRQVGADIYYDYEADDWPTFEQPNSAGAGVCAKNSGARCIRGASIRLDDSLGHRRRGAGQARTAHNVIRRLRRRSSAAPPTASAPMTHRIRPEGSGTRVTA